MGDKPYLMKIQRVPNWEAREAPDLSILNMNGTYAGSFWTYKTWLKATGRKLKPGEVIVVELHIKESKRGK